jgi:hypothetical protein
VLDIYPPVVIFQMTRSEARLAVAVEVAQHLARLLADALPSSSDQIIASELAERLTSASANLTADLRDIVAVAQ